MDWNGGTNLKSFVSRQSDSPFSFLYNCNYDQYSGMEVIHPAMSMSTSTETLQGMVQVTDKNIDYGTLMSMEKKKRLTTEQIESLERSFLEEIKLDPVRKMKLARELSLHPRQVAVWFQNRRARWKSKQLERLYDGLKQEFDAISTEKQRLQEEVLKLKCMLREQGMVMRRSSGEETVDSASETIRSNSINKVKARASQHQIAECSYVLNMEEYHNPSTVSVTPQPYWPLLPPPFQ